MKVEVILIISTFLSGINNNYYCKLYRLNLHKEQYLLLIFLLPNGFADTISGSVVNQMECFVVSISIHLLTV